MVAPLSAAFLVIKQLLQFFEKHGPEIASVLRTAALLVEVASKAGKRWNLEDAEAWRNSMKQLITLKARELLLNHGESSLHNELDKMEKDMEKKVTPD